MIQHTGLHEEEINVTNIYVYVCVCVIYIRWLRSLYIPIKKIADINRYRYNVKKKPHILKYFVTIGFLHPIVSSFLCFLVII